MEGFFKGILWPLLKTYLPDIFCCFYFFFSNEHPVLMKCPVQIKAYPKAFAFE